MHGKLCATGSNGRIGRREIGVCCGIAPGMIASNTSGAWTEPVFFNILVDFTDYRFFIAILVIIKKSIWGGGELLMRYLPPLPLYGATCRSYQIRSQIQLCLGRQRDRNSIAIIS